MKNLSITLKVIIYVSILGFSCIFAMGYVSISAADEILVTNAHEHLKTLQSIKKLQIEGFIENKMNAIGALSNMPATRSAITDLEVETSSGKSNGTSYQNKYNGYARVFKNYMDANNLTNIMFIEPKEGFVYFSVDRAHNLHSKLSQESNMLSGLWRSCMKSDAILISDMELQSQNNDDPAIFIGSRIVENGQVVAVLIAEISNKAINEIMTTSEGLGETGESYIVGDDFYFRSDSRFSAKSTILNQKVKTVATESVFAGTSGIGIITDYRGIEVLSSYAELDIGGLDWAIITEIDEDEIMGPKRRLINTILIICGIIACIMMPVLFIIGRSLSLPLKMEVAYAKKLANGELDAVIEINQKDEIGVLADALREIAHRTKQVITSVMDATNNLADASFQLSSSSQDLSSGASEQASSVEEVSASMGPRPSH